MIYFKGNNLWHKSCIVTELFVWTWQSYYLFFQEWSRFHAFMGLFWISGKVLRQCMIYFKGNNLRHKSCIVTELFVWTWQWYYLFFRKWSRFHAFMGLFWISGNAVAIEVLFNITSTNIQKNTLYKQIRTHDTLISVVISEVVCVFYYFLLIYVIFFFYIFTNIIEKKSSHFVEH